MWNVQWLAKNIGTQYEIEKFICKTSLIINVTHGNRRISSIVRETSKKCQVSEATKYHNNKERRPTQTSANSSQYKPSPPTRLHRHLNENMRDAYDRPSNLTRDRILSTRPHAPTGCTFQPSSDPLDSRRSLFGAKLLEASRWQLDFTYCRSVFIRWAYQHSLHAWCLGSAATLPLVGLNKPTREIKFRADDWIIFLNILSCSTVLFLHTHIA
jgi:hypothetical protein